MKIVQPSYQILTDINPKTMLKVVELAGRTCYKTEDKITEDSYLPFTDKIVNQFRHHSVLEHTSLSVKFVCNRGFSHEMVRHRLASYSQESTRYVNYSKDKSDNQITVIEPCWFSKESTKYDLWYLAMHNAETTYLDLIRMGATAGEARGVLPIDTKTEIVVTANLREWIHIFNMRTAPQAHKSMQQLMRPLLKELKTKIPVVFDECKDY